MRTVMFFNGPRRPRLPELPFSRRKREERKARRAARKAARATSSPIHNAEGMGSRGNLNDEAVKLPRHLGEAGGVVLVTGATGGVGKRVVEELRRKGLPVRAMVRA